MPARSVVPVVPPVARLPRAAPVAVRFTIAATPCDCKPGTCAHFVEPQGDCVCWLRRGVIETRHCPVCDPKGKGETWHHDGQCLRCRNVLDGLAGELLDEARKRGLAP